MNHKVLTLLSQLDAEVANTLKLKAENKKLKDLLERCLWQMQIEFFERDEDLETEILHATDTYIGMCPCSVKFNLPMILPHEDVFGNLEYKIACDNCGMETEYYYDSEAEASRAWNEMIGYIPENIDKIKKLEKEIKRLKDKYE